MAWETLHRWDHPAQSPGAVAVMPNMSIFDGAKLETLPGATNLDRYICSVAIIGEVVLAILTKPSRDLKNLILMDSLVILHRTYIFSKTSERKKTTNKSCRFRLYKMLKRKFE